MFFILIAAFGVGINTLAFFVNGSQGNFGWMVVNFACACICAACLGIELEKR